MAMTNSLSFMGWGSGAETDKIGEKYIVNS